MLGHVHIDCATRGCFAVITLHPQEEDRLRETHETFYCPAGHSNYFPGKTRTEKRIERLKADLQRLEGNLRSAEQIRDRWRELAEGFRESMLELRNGVRVCPLGCGWHSTRRLTGWPPDEEDVARYLDRVWSDLREHLVREHNATLRPVALLEAGPSKESQGA